MFRGFHEYPCSLAEHEPGDWGFVRGLSGGWKVSILAAEGVVWSVALGEVWDKVAGLHVASCQDGRVGEGNWMSSSFLEWAKNRPGRDDSKPQVLCWDDDSGPRWIDVEDYPD